MKVIIYMYHHNHNIPIAHTPVLVGIHTHTHTHTLTNKDAHKPRSNKKSNKVGLWMIVLGNEHLVLKLLVHGSVRNKKEYTRTHTHPHTHTHTHTHTESQVCP